MTVTTLRPISNGTYNALICSIDGLVGSPLAYVSMNDQSDLTYCYTDPTNIPPVLGGYETFPCTMFNSSGGAITNVRVWIRFHTDIAGGRHAVCRTTVLISGTLYSGANMFSSPITNTFVDYPTNPNTLVAWTDSDINNAQFGGFGSANLTLDALLYESWVEVTWTPVVTTKLRRLLVGEGL